MAAKRVTDVTGDYGREPARPARDAEVRRIKRGASRIKTGRLERDVDRLLRARGLSLDEPLAEAVRDFRKARLKGGNGRGNRLR